MSDAGSSRRTREFLRYAEIVLGLGFASSDVAAVSSADPSLTAYAQLVALRLNAKRAVISLFDKSAQYILAEATQTLSLQQDEVHDAGDALFWGSQVLPRDEFFTLALKPHKTRSDQETDGAVVLNDLHDHHSGFSQHSYVIDHPFARAYAAVPLINPSGFAIGTLALVDDKARPNGLNSIEVKFMQDVATTVVRHLEMERTRFAHARGMRLVKGLSRFMEGKESIEDELGLQGKFSRPNTYNAWLTSSLEGQRIEAFANKQSTETAKLGASRRTHALNSATNFERLDEAQQQVLDRRSNRHSGSQTLGFRARSASPPPPISANGVESPASPEREAHHSSGASQRNAEARQEELLSKDVKKSFERAAKIIQQAMGVSGVLFLNASVASFGGARHTGEGPNQDNSSGRTSHSDPNDTSGEKSGESTNETDSSSRQSSRRREFCTQFGSAYQRTPDDGIPRVLHRGIPESFLQALIKCFPYGRIFNFDNNKLLSSDEHSDSSTAVEALSPGEDTAASIKQQKRRHKTARTERDEASILKLFPGVRSLGVMPMWDSHRERFFAGAIVWTYSRSRVLSYQDDMNYLGAFCDVIMAETGRLDSQAEMRAKQDFISSISHELRSPLHGILGAVDCLQDGDPNTSAQMLYMIETCGRSLLDVINNLLSHANNRKQHHVGKSKPARFGRAGFRTIEPVSDLAVVTEEIMDTALWSAPQALSRLRSSEKLNDLPHKEGVPPLKLILEIDSSNLTESKWHFHVDAGAWRRILQNLTTNAIKYTDPGGFYKVTLSARPSIHGKSDKVQRIELKCVDSGRGMSEDFLREGLFQAFKQEDSHTQGTGLGLSLVRSLIDDMGGTIDVQSKKGEGTTFIVGVPLTRGVSTRHQNAESSKEERERARLKGVTFALQGFGAEDADDDRLRTAKDVVLRSIEKACQDLGLVHHAVSHAATEEPDITIISEQQALSARNANADEMSILSGSWDRCVVLCDSAKSSRAFARGIPGAVVVSQPFGPRKLSKACSSCLDKMAMTLDETSPEAANHRPPPADRMISDQSLLGSEGEAIARAWFAAAIPSRGAPAQDSASSSPRSSSISFSVLIVDDNSVNLALLRGFMKKLGHKQVSATNGLEALEVYQDAHTKAPVRSPSGMLPPTVIFMDIMMPVMDGHESTRRIRAFERSLDLEPAMIVALTAQASTEAMHEAYASGINVFLSKPVRLQALQQVFEDLSPLSDA